MMFKTYFMMPRETRKPSRPPLLCFAAIRLRDYTAPYQADTHASLYRRVFAPPRSFPKQPPHATMPLKSFEKLPFILTDRRRRHLR